MRPPNWPFFSGPPKAIKLMRSGQKPAGIAGKRTKPVPTGRANGGNTHIAAEMFVAAELAKRGYSLSLTMGNAKAVDDGRNPSGRVPSPFTDPPRIAPQR